MKTAKMLTICVVSALMMIGFSGLAFAFHDGGVAQCEGCHTMHNSQGGVANAKAGSVGQGVSNLLTKGSDPSSTCLVCHGQGAHYSVFSTDGSAFTPGGDFYWVTKAFSWKTYYGATKTSAAKTHGHNIVAGDFGLIADTMAAPGGAYAAAKLGCNSCHDPHAKKGGTGVLPTDPNATPIARSGSYSTGEGEQGNFRLLGGIGYDGGYGGGASFTAPAPIALAAGTTAPETDIQHTDYGQGMSAWCANCHGAMHNNSSAPGTKMIHPSGTLAKINNYTNYNSYVKTGDFTGGQATSRTALIPFELGTDNQALLDVTTTKGPDGTANVMCLTCHRAHASAWDDAGRWNFNATLTNGVVSTSDPANDGGLDTDGRYTLDNTFKKAYYGRDMVSAFGPEQRNLCNKCHVQD